MRLELSSESWQVLFAFGFYLLGVVFLGVFAHRYLTRGSFVKEYFLGNRGLGPWVLALTVAATAISGGTFMGFPSLIYSNGWVMALWIAGYMVVPLLALAFIGKRLNQVSRLTGAVTVPDVFRDRFQSPALGITASLLILLFLVFNLVAQFKAGGLVMKEALRLPAASATFRSARVEAGRFLVLTFALSDGHIETQRTPLPSDKAVYLPDRTQVEEQKQEVQVGFRVEDGIVEKTVRFPPQSVRFPWLGWRVDAGYLIGLLIFALTVIGYTTYGGYWAVTWTDVLEGLVMLIGVVVMAILAMRAVPAIDGQTGLAAATEHLRRLTPPGGEKGSLVHGPGPNNFLGLGLAFSFFLIWSLGAAGQPSGMVRLMSFKDTPSLRRALMLVACYYLLTYLSMLIIFTCARAIFPTQYLREIGSEGEPDSIMPAMTRHLAHPLVAGLLLAAPYAAIMSTVAAFLLMISSSLVRDLYQRVINPRVPEKTLKRLSYLATALVGVGVLFGAINPPRFLQYIIVFTGTGQTCSFMVPMALSLYWRRATRQGILAGMLGGFLVLFGFYVLGWIDSRSERAIREYESELVASQGTEEKPAEPVLWHSLRKGLHWVPGWGTQRPDPFAPLYPGGLDPLVWGLLASLTLCVGVSWLTRPDQQLLAKFFPADK